MAIAAAEAEGMSRVQVNAVAIAEGQEEYQGALPDLQLTGNVGPGHAPTAKIIRPVQR